MDTRAIALLQQMGVTIWESRQPICTKTTHLDLAVVCDHPEQLQTSKLWQGLNKGLEPFSLVIQVLSAEQLASVESRWVLWFAKQLPEQDLSGLLGPYDWRSLAQQGTLKRQVWESLVDALSH
ncbi:DNA polymerase III subunit psi [Celerinatantimonas yamalensis]|uniref:DNA polymerase III subunit psi n=1 Tax=Celerinatantimonas yamalensis TaxID=559956 RepID=A0ABW9G7H0_9GAMM